MRGSMMLFVGLLCAGALGIPNPSIAAHLDIVALGASDTDGPFVGRQETYPAQLEAALRSAGYDVTVENWGRSGATTETIRQRAASVPNDVRIVILQPGGNDQLGSPLQGGRTFDHDQTIANLTATVKDLRERGIQVLMWQYYEDRTGFDAHSFEIANQYGAVFLHGFHWRVPQTRDFHLSDGHMTAAGYGLVVARILDDVKQAIARVTH